MSCTVGLCVSSRLQTLLPINSDNQEILAIFRKDNSHLSGNVILAETPFYFGIKVIMIPAHGKKLGLIC